MIYFRGCTARQKEVSIQDSTEKLLKYLNIDYHTLDDESCCGSVLLRTGFVEDAEFLIEKNSEKFSGETVLTSCAGCYKTFREDYDDVDVIHISQLLADFSSDFSGTDLNVTYHDSCHLARHCEIFDEPRRVINAVANLCEMENIKKDSLCCGAGGGVKSAYPEIASHMADLRIKQAMDTGSEILITSCPFCKLNLKDRSMDVLDLTEFLVKYGDFNEE